VRGGSGSSVVGEVGRSWRLGGTSEGGAGGTNVVEGLGKKGRGHGGKRGRTQ
jgi:hypothetical protein